MQLGHPSSGSRLTFWLSGLGLWLLLLVWLVWHGPQYEPDLHYYLTGALHWHHSHPPGYNIFLSVCQHVWPTAWLPVALQLLAYSLAAQLVAVYGLRLRGRALVATTLLLVLEPATRYLLLSLQSEGFFMAALLLLLWALLTRRAAWQVGLLLGLAYLFRYQAWFSLPVVLGWVAWQAKGHRWWWPTLQALGAYMVVVLLVQGGHLLMGNQAYPTAGKTLWDATSATDAPPLPGNRTAQLADSLRSRYHTHWQLPRARYAYGEHALELRRAELAAQGQAAAWQMADSEIGEQARAAMAQDMPTAWYHLLADNAHTLLAQPWLEYRHLPHYRPGMAREYAELDSMVQQLYGYTIQYNSQPQLWQEPDALALWMWAALALSLAMTACMLAWLRTPATLGTLLFAGIPVGMLYVSVPVQARFVLAYAPCLMLLSVVWVRVVLKKLLYRHAKGVDDTYKG